MKDKELQDLREEVARIEQEEKTEKEKYRLRKKLGKLTRAEKIREFINEQFKR